MPSLKEELDIALLEKHQAWHEARGMLSPSKALTTNKLTASYSKRVSYNRRDGFGTSVGISRNNNVVMPGVGATISRSEYGGFGADITSNQYGQTEGAGGRPGFGGVSGGLSWGERDGFTASFNVSGTNAFSYNSQTGLSSNSDFLSQYAMNNGLSQGVAQTDEEKAHTARVEAEERARAAQNRNNQESGAAAVSGAGVLTQRRDEDGLPAHGAPGLNDPGQTLSSSGSFGPEGESSGVGRRPLSSEDKAAFWENWRGETRAQTDASLADLRRMGYDTSELEGRVQAYRNNQDSRPGSAIVVTGSRTPTLSERANSLFGSVVDGVKGLWNRATGGTIATPLPNSLIEGSYNYKPSREPNGVSKPLADGAILPGKGYNVTSEFGSRPDPFGKNPDVVVHAGMDIGMPVGTPVVATSSGTVVFAGLGERGSINVKVDHGNGLVSIFKHNSEVLVQVGQHVVRGQEISKSGDTGPSTGPHLHYELRLNGVAKDPTTFNIRDWQLRQ
ncbi:peptidase, M23 family [Leptospira santarosai str. 2000027870]|uniref:M23 family metallopeptidase n=2 Tax=Leptospira santarosai TaxID=28183 RepID=UPI0002BDE6B9|nr:M23 family metallopeptidase [Leptospira santarosai]EMM87795.1 peptidase, M23 family [Leptospira santarosai str. 2000027870]